MEGCKELQQVALIGAKKGSGKPSKITDEMKTVVERQTEQDNETTAYQLHKLLTECGFRC